MVYYILLLLLLLSVCDYLFFFRVPLCGDLKMKCFDYEREFIISISIEHFVSKK